MTDQQTKITGVLGEDEKTGGFSGNIKINDFEYTVNVVPDTKTSKTGAVYQEMTFEPKDGGPATRGSMFRSDKMFNIVNKPGIQMYVNHGDGRDPETMKFTGFYKTTKKDGTPSRRPYYSVGLWRPNPNAVAAQQNEEAPF